MKETRFILFTITYTLIAAVFTFRFGPDMVQGAKAFDAAELEFKAISEMSLKLKKRYPVKKYKLGNKVYDTDSMPLKVAFDTGNLKYRYLIANMKMDTLPLTLTFDMQQESKRLENFISVLDNAKIIRKGLLEEELPKTLSGHQLTGIRNVKLVLERKGDFQNTNNYLEINGRKIQGYNIKLRKIVGLVIAYSVWVLSAICLLLIPLGGVAQLKAYRSKGIPPTIPNWWEDTRDLFKRSLRKKD